MSDDSSDRTFFDEADSSRVDAWLDGVENAWDRMGVPARMRRRLAVELQQDIDSAVVAGADVTDLLHDDVMGFARELAEANGIDLEPQTVEPAATIGRLILTAISGALLGAAISWFVLFPVLLTDAGQASDLALAVVLYGVGAAVILGCAVGAVRWRFHKIPAVDKYTLARIGLGMALGGLVGVLPTVLFASATGYSSAGIVVAMEAAVAGLFCSAGIALMLRFTRRHESRASQAIA